MMKSTSNKSAGLLLFVTMTTTLLMACHKDSQDPETPQVILNEEEVITTCKLYFTDISGTSTDTIAIYRDADGDGGNGPTQFDTIFLKSGTHYATEIILLNETISPADSISNEVEEEGQDHLFCFGVNNAALNIERTDSDGTYEIGLHSEWTATSASTGSVTITLKHQPGIKDGTCIPGDTDLEIQFPLVITD